MDCLYVCAIVALLAYLIMWSTQILFNAIYLYWRNNRSLLIKHIIEIQDGALYVETEFNRSYHYWHGLTKIINRPGFIAVYIHADTAQIVPSRAFSSTGHRLDFLAALTGKLHTT